MGPVPAGVVVDRCKSVWLRKLRRGRSIRKLYSLPLFSSNAEADFMQLAKDGCRLNGIRFFL